MIVLVGWLRERRASRRPRARRLPAVPVFVEPDEVRFAPDVRAHSPEASTQPYPKAPPTVSTVRGDDFDRVLEQERAAIRRQKDNP